MGDKVSPKVNQRSIKIIEHFKELSSEDKIATLDKIIDVCEASELKHLSDRLEIFLKRDFVRFLPTEICIYLLSWLDPASLGRCCLVSKTWNEAVKACQPAWIRACRNIGWKVDETITSGSYWKNTYQRALKRLKQLKNGSAFKVSTLIGHTARVYTLRYNGKDLLASGSDDRSVRLWDVATGECLQVVHTHTCADLAFDQYFVYTASFDNTIACWDWNSGSLIRSYRGHTGAVFSVSYDEDRDLLVSGSADKTVRLWQISSGEQINMYHGHREWVTKVILRRSEVESLHHKPGDFVILSMDKMKIKIWLISQEVNCESLCELSANDFSSTSIKNSHPPVNGESVNISDHCFLHPQLLFDGSRIMCSSERGILEWDFKDYTLVKVTPHPNDSLFLLGAGKSLLLAADTQENCLFIRVYDTNAGPQHQACSSNHERKLQQEVSDTTGQLSPSPETVDYEVEQDTCNKPCCSTDRLPNFAVKLTANPTGVSVTPTDELGETEQPSQQISNTEDELMNDFNCNTIKPRKGLTLTPFFNIDKKLVGSFNSTNHNGDSQHHPKIGESPAILGQWNLPMCRWSKRGSNYVCGDQSWLNGFSDVNHTALVFAAALPDHSIYLLHWSDCS